MNRNSREYLLSRGLHFHVDLRLETAAVDLYPYPPFKLYLDNLVSSYPDHHHSPLGCFKLLRRNKPALPHQPCSLHPLKKAKTLEHGTRS